MALVGEAHILVRAITTNVEKDIRKAFSNVNGNAATNAGASLGASFSRGLRNNIDGNVFSRLADRIGELAPNADGARLAFQGMVRSSYVAGTAISVLLGAISSLIGGLGALVGAAGQAAVGLVAVGGAAVALKVGFSVAGLAFKGISQAVSAATSANKNYSDSLRKAKFDAEEAALAVDDAALALEKAIEARNRVADLPVNSRARREADLNVKKAELALRKAKDAEKNAGKVAGGGTAATDPYAGLTPSQKAFAQFLAGLKTKMDEIKEATAKGFLPLLQAQMQRLIDAGALDIIKARFYDIGRGMGLAAKNFTNILIARDSLKTLDTVLKNISQQIPPMGNIFGSLFDGLLGVLKLADPATRNFIKYLEGKSTAFANFFTFKGDAKDSPIAKFFVESEKMLERFFGIFGNIFKTISTLVEANFGPGSGGEIMVQWLEKTTKGWANMGRDVNGNLTPAFKNFFSGAATNTTKILDSVGALIKEFLKLGDMPEIGQTFDILKAGAPAIGELLRAGIKAGPALANLVVQISRILVALADSEGPKVFFDTLTAFATTVADIFESEVAQKILKAIGGFLAFALAIGTVIKVTKFFGNVFLGSFKAIFDTIGKFVGALGSVQSFFVRLILGGMQFGGVIGTLLGTLGRVGLFLTGPWGIAIAAAVTALTWFFTQTEVGKKLFKGFLDFLGSIWTGITDGWNALVTGISSALSGFGKFFQDTWNGLVAFFKPMIDGFAIAFQTAWAVIKAIIDIIVAVFTIAFVGIGWVVQGVWNGIKANFEFMWNLLKPVVEGVQKFFEPIFKGIGDFIGTVWKGIQIGFQRFIDWIKPPLDALFGFFKTVFDNIKNFLKGVINTYIGFAEGFVNFFIRGLNFIIDRINTIKLAIPEIMRPLFGGKKEIGFNITRVAEVSLPRLAKGGVVYPSSGGSMVTVAEAGRPERIEPLNPNGLSDRDMAIINKLSGTSGPQIQVTVNPSAKMDERELAMQVSRQIAYEIRKGGY